MGDVGFKGSQGCSPAPSSLSASSRTLCAPCGSCSCAWQCPWGGLVSRVDLRKGEGSRLSWCSDPAAPTRPSPLPIHAPYSSHPQSSPGRVPVSSYLSHPHPKTFLSSPPCHLPHSPLCHTGSLLPSCDPQTVPRQAQPGAISVSLFGVPQLFQAVLPPHWTQGP